MHGRDVQQPGYAESTAADLGKPSADAEHAVGSIYAQYDAVTGSKSRVGLPGMKQKHVYTSRCIHVHVHPPYVHVHPPYIHLPLMLSQYRANPGHLDSKLAFRAFCCST